MVNFQINQVSTVPNNKSPFSAFSLAPSTLSKIHLMLVAEQYASIIDKVNKVVDRYPTTSEDLLNALKKTSSAFNLAGASIDETIALKVFDFFAVFLRDIPQFLHV